MNVYESIMQGLTEAVGYQQGRCYMLSKGYNT